MKNIYAKKIIQFIGIFSVVLSLPTFSYAESSCLVEPFVTMVKQGETATTSVIIKGGENSEPFDLTLGSLPKSIESGFLKTTNIETVGNTKKIPLILQTKSNAQIGSFMISVVYKSSQANEFICQFNLEVKKNTFFKEDSTGSAGDTLTQTISSGTFVNLGVQPVGTTTKVTQMITTSDQVEHKIITKKIIDANNTRLFKKRLSLRSSGEEVKRLQKVLKSLMLYPSDEPVSGYFGPITEKAVKEFQKNNTIETLGIVGPKTRKILEEIYK